MRALLFAVATFALLASADAGECKNDTACKAPERCVAVASGKRCARACDPKAPQCPADTRCVKDGGSHVCRPINDGVDL